MKAIRWLAESEVALRAISQAAELFSSEKELGRAAHEKESARDLVTPLDTLIEKRLLEILRPHSSAIVSEEQRTADQAIPDDIFKRSWWLDPIDGTVNFAVGLPFYGTSLAWMEKGRFVTGAALLPSVNELLFTYGDQGTFLNGRKVSVGAGPAKLAASLVGATFSSAKVQGPTKQAREIEYQLFGRINDASRGAVRLGSALAQLCYAATGRLQAVYGAFAQGWDIGAGLVLAEGAGLEVRYVRMPGSTRFHYVAGRAGVVPELVEHFKALKVPGLSEL